MENPRWPQAVFMAWDMPIWLNYAFEIYILSIFNLWRFSKPNSYSVPWCRWINSPLLLYIFKCFFLSYLFLMKCMHFSEELVCQQQQKMRLHKSLNIFMTRYRLRNKLSGLKFISWSTLMIWWMTEKNKIIFQCIPISKSIKWSQTVSSEWKSNYNTCRRFFLVT